MKVSDSRWHELLSGTEADGAPDEDEEPSPPWPWSPRKRRS
jgi:hypothetical protein